METKKIILSVAIAVYNEETNLDACLSSVRPIADEIVVVDGGSSDKTVTIAKKYADKIICTTNPSMFHINKQKALDACKGTWILQLDADETVPEDLKEEITRTVHGSTAFNGFKIARKNYFWGHLMTKGGLYPDYVIRLVRRGKARFPAVSVHEQIEVDGTIGTLVHPMHHMSYRSRSDYWRKADAYTSLTAAEMKKNGVKKNIWNWFLYTIVKPKMTFLTIYIRHKGFMDGWYGFIFALYSALHYPIAYKKFSQL